MNSFILTYRAFSDANAVASILMKSYPFLPILLSFAFFFSFFAALKSFGLGISLSSSSHMKQPPETHKRRRGKGF